jgi:hypothetical protein
MKKNTLPGAVIVSLWCLLFLNLSLHPDPYQERFRLSGIVKNAAQKPVAGAAILVESLMDDNIRLETATNAGGEWSVIFYDTGIWRIDVSKAGYRPFSQAIVTIKKYALGHRDPKKRRISDLSTPRKTWYALVHTEIHKGLKDLPDTITLSTFQNTPLEFILKKADSGTLKEAKKAIYQRNWQQAVGRLKQFIGEFPGSEETPAALYWLAYCQNQQGGEAQNPKQRLDLKGAAMAYLNRLIQHFPDSQWRDDAAIFRIDIAHSLYIEGSKKYKHFINEAAADTAPAKIDLRLAAIDALMNIDRPQAVRHLKNILKQNRQTGVRRKAILVLSRFPDQQTIDILEEVTANDADAGVRAEAQLLLEQIEALKKTIKGG